MIEYDRYTYIFKGICYETLENCTVKFHIWAQSMCYILLSREYSDLLSFVFLQKRIKLYHTHHLDDSEGHPVVKAAVLDSDGHDEAAEEHVVGRVLLATYHLFVFFANFFAKQFIVGTYIQLINIHTNGRTE